MPWIVKSINDGGRGPIGASWYIVNTATGRKRCIGPVKLKGVNYHDRAVALAKQRNKEETKGGT